MPKTFLERELQLSRYLADYDYETNFKDKISRVTYLFRHARWSINCIKLGWAIYLENEEQKGVNKHGR